MDKKQAFDLIVKATARLQADRETHEVIKQALALLKPEDPKTIENKA